MALTGVSCPTSSLCVAVDAVGNALVSTSPTTGAWTTPFKIAGSNALASVSCAGATSCVAVDKAGEAIASASPAAGPSAWHARAIDPALTFQAVSCAPSGVCAAVDGSGNVFASVDPTEAAPTWVAKPIDSASALASVACISRPICLAVDGAGQSFVSDDPAAVPPTWAYYPADSGAGLTGLSCTQDGFCAAVDAKGRLVTTALPPPPVAAPPPAVLVRPHPTISGVPAVGSRLVCDPGVPSEAEATLTYAWWRDESPIANAAASSYLVGKADAKHHLQCVVTATNAAGSTTAHSAFVTIPAAGVLAAAGETFVGKAHVHGNRLEVPVKCSPRALHVCVINLRMTAVEALRGNRVIALYAQRSKASRARQVTVTLGKGRVRLAPSQQRTIVVPLVASARRLLVQRRRLPAQLTVAGTVIGVLNATLARQHVTFTR